MRKRLVTLLMLGILSFIPTVSVFSPPSQVYAAEVGIDKSISFDYISDTCISVRDLKDDLYVVAYDGVDYYKLMQETTNVDGEITCYRFTADNKLNISEKELSDAVVKGDILVFSEEEFNSEKDVRGIFSDLESPIQKYFFFNKDGVLLAEATPQDLEKLVDNEVEESKIDFSVEVTDADADGAYLRINYKLYEDDVINNIYALDEEGKVVDSTIFDTDEPEGVVDKFLSIKNKGTYTLVLVTGNMNEATTKVEIDSSVFEEASAPKKIVKDETKPEVTFSNTKTPTEYGDTLTITMKTSVEAQMRFGAAAEGEYKKSNKFDITENGTYKYEAITRSGVVTEGTLKIDCFKPHEDIKPDIEVTVANTSSRLPKTGVVATGLIISGVGIGAGAYLVKRGLKRKENKDEEE